MLTLKFWVFDPAFSTTCLLSLCGYDKDNVLSRLYDGLYKSVISNLDSWASPESFPRGANKLKLHHFPGGAKPWFWNNFVGFNGQIKKMSRARRRQLPPLAPLCRRPWWTVLYVALFACYSCVRCWSFICHLGAPFSVTSFNYHVNALLYTCQQIHKISLSINS